MRPSILILNRDATETPEDNWYQIEVSGDHPAGKGQVQRIDDQALQSICNLFAEVAKEPGFAGILIDRDHLSHDMKNDTEAMGWLHEVEIRDGQLWGRVIWTDIGKTAILNRRYKFFSTEYSPDAAEEVAPGVLRPLELLGLALTNRPNNKGGRPIANRAGDNQSPDHAGNHGNETNNMKTIAEKLGLPAEATEEQILSALDAMQSELEKYKLAANEMEVEQILNRHESRIPAGQRDAWKEQLIANRAPTEKLLSGLPETVKRDAAQDRIHNRATAGTPTVALACQPDAAGKAARQEAAARLIMNRDNCRFEIAWERATREHSELFA